MNRIVRAVSCMSVLIAGGAVGASDWQLSSGGVQCPRAPGPLPPAETDSLTGIELARLAQESERLAERALALYDGRVPGGGLDEGPSYWFHVGAARIAAAAATVAGSDAHLWFDAGRLTGHSAYLVEGEMDTVMAEAAIAYLGCAAVLAREQGDSALATDANNLRGTIAWGLDQARRIMGRGQVPRW